MFVAEDFQGSQSKICSSVLPFCFFLTTKGQTGMFVFSNTVFNTFFMFSFLYQQINFVKAQQDDIIANFDEEYLDLEREIAGLGLEVCYFMQRNFHCR